MTIFVAWLTWATVRALSSVMILYGRRRTVMMLLFGFLYGYFFKSVGYVDAISMVIDLSIIGYIIPGLIAIWIERQGLMETISTLITSSVIVRLLLILITNGDLSI